MSTKLSFASVAVSWIIDESLGPDAPEGGAYAPPSNEHY
jgi:hypothetical protein